MVNLNKYVYSDYKKLQAEYQQESLKVYSGNKINKGSEDSNLFHLSLSIKEEMYKIDLVNTQLNYINSELTQAETSMAEIVGIMETIKSKVLLSKEPGVQKEVLSNEIRGYRENIKTLLNTSINGVYVFSGTKTNSSPIQEDNNKYVTSENLSKKKILTNSSGVYNEIGILASDVVFYNDKNGNKKDLLQDLNTLSNLIEGYETDIDGNQSGLLSTEERNDKLSKFIGLVDLQIDNVIKEQSILGYKNKNINNAIDSNQVKKFNLEKYETEQLSVDLTESLLNMKNMENTFQSIFYTMQKMNEISLVNFLK